MSFSVVTHQFKFPEPETRDQDYHNAKERLTKEVKDVRPVEVCSLVVSLIYHTGSSIIHVEVL